MKSKIKLQSAMEYLMTYGWAILIIAVVLGALFALGFFNSANLAPKVSAGSCQVYRPLGPGTTTNINTAGVCNNELPQYVAMFNGATANITTSATGLPQGSSPRSVFAWVYVTSDSCSGTNSCSIFSYGKGVVDGRSLLYLTGAASKVSFYSGTSTSISSFALPAGTWQFVGYTYVAGAMQVAIYDDQNSNTISTPNGNVLATGNSAAQPPSIGQENGGGPFIWVFNGLIANVQVYNTSLGANDVYALYQEGIGGSPQDLSYLVAWWPLNGNANDYSGNLNNGVPTNVIFTSSWTAGYTAP